MIALRSLIFNIAFYVNLIVLMILGLPAMFWGRHGVFFMARTWAVTSIWLLDKICGLRVEFRGVETLPTAATSSPPSISRSWRPSRW